uniref:Uncharacterized protein ycf20 n=1 Tax=Symphyocladiella dendroidea TaxID=2506487 RepID=A0A1Z1M6W8_9FLOR|nr:hypothetical protein [Symphyocladiella dendroidea]ARW61837.1 hypothetical protein [Symphyocladiella dendroidea]
MSFNISILSLMLGFFFANILSTIPAQTGDWNIMSGSIIVTLNELTNKYIYKTNNTDKFLIFRLLNNIKIGIIYGLFVDAFKLGS